MAEVAIPPGPPPNGPPPMYWLLDWLNVMLKPGPREAVEAVHISQGI